MDHCTCILMIRGWFSLRQPHTLTCILITGGKDFTPGRYNATFTTGVTTATASIPIMAGGNDDIKQFSLRLFIDGILLQQCIFSGNISTATVIIIPGIICIHDVGIKLLRK